MQGPLCEEPMIGVAFIVDSILVHEEEKSESFEEKGGKKIKEKLEVKQFNKWENV